MYIYINNTEFAKIHLHKHITHVKSNDETICFSTIEAQFQMLTASTSKNVRKSARNRTGETAKNI